MPVCDTCGNDYANAFTITTHDGQVHTFDSFECAVHALAPRCACCHVRVMGHGLEANGNVYCCEHCASRDGVDGLRDSLDDA